MAGHGSTVNAVALLLRIRVVLILVGSLCTFWFVIFDEFECVGVYAVFGFFACLFGVDDHEADAGVVSEVSVDDGFLVVFVDAYNFHFGSVSGFCADSQIRWTIACCCGSPRFGRGSF